MDSTLDPDFPSARWGGASSPLILVDRRLGIALLAWWVEVEADGLETGGGPESSVWRIFS